MKEDFATKVSDERGEIPAVEGGEPYVEGKILIKNDAIIASEDVGKQVLED